MEENLLGEEERISDDDDMLEMPTVRESFSEILNTAGLSKYKPKFAKHGIQSTSHLDDIIEDDLEELGLSGFQRRQFKKAVTNVKKKKKIGLNLLMRLVGLAEKDCYQQTYMNILVGMLKTQDNFN